MGRTACPTVQQGAPIFSGFDGQTWISVVVAGAGTAPLSVSDLLGAEQRCNFVRIHDRDHSSTRCLANQASRSGVRYLTARPILRKGGPGVRPLRLPSMRLCRRYGTDIAIYRAAVFSSTTLFWAWSVFFIMHQRLMLSIEECQIRKSRLLLPWIVGIHY